MKRESNYTGFFKNHETKRITISATILIIVITVSGALYSYLLADMLNSELSSAMGAIVYGVLALAIFATGYFFLTRVEVNFVKNGGSPLHSKFFFKAVKVVFITSAAIHAIIFIEIALTSRYHLALSMITMSSSFLLGSSVIAVLTYRFLSWYGSRHDMMLLLFGLSYASVAVGLTLIATANLVALVATDTAQQQGPHIINPGASSGDKLRGELYSTIFLITLIPGRISFVLYWAATAILLRNYAQYMGKARFWVAISVPMALYIVASVLIFSNYANSQFVRAVVMLVSLVISGIFFSIVFLTTGRIMKRMSHEGIAHYLTAAGFGVFLFVISTTSPVHLLDWVRTPFPPLASPVWSFASVAAYVYSFGVFFTTVAISRDVQLRKSIRKIAAREPQLFGRIGTAAMENEVNTRIEQIIREQENIIKKEQEEVQTDLTEAEVKSYIDDAMAEIGKTQTEM